MSLTMDLSNLTLSGCHRDPFDPVQVFSGVDFFFDWGLDLSVEKADKILSFLSSVRSDLSQVSIHDIEIRYFPCKFISMKLIETFLAVFLKEENSIESAMTFVKEYGRGKGHVAAFEYLLLGIQVFMNEGEGMEGLKIAHEKLENTVGVLAVRQFYLGLNKGDSLPQQKDILRKMIAEDSEYYEWPYRLHRALQSERRLGEGPPQTEEIDLISRAYSLAPDNPDVILTYCHCLSDFLRPIPADNLGLLSFGTKKKFSGVQHVLKFLKQEVCKMLYLDPVCLKFSLGAVSIFSSSLPHCYRDQGFAKLCLDMALTFHHSSPRALLRRGFFALLIEGNADTSVGYFEIAYNLNKSNFSALTALLLAYFRNRVEKEEKVKRILSMQLKANWDNENLAHLYFIQGLYEFLNGPQTAALSWIQSYLLSPQKLATCFELLGWMRRRFKWPTVYENLVCLPMFCACLKEVKLPEEKQVLLKKVRSEIKKAGRQEDMRGDREVREEKPKTFRSKEPIQEKPQEAYKILGVKIDAARHAVLEKYRKLVLIYHPAVNPNLPKEESEENLKRFKDYNWALEALLI